MAVKIAESQESQGMAAERTTPATIRARLLALAEFECLEPALVHRLDDADVMACAGESDATLTAYLHALDMPRGWMQGWHRPAGRLPLLPPVRPRAAVAGLSADCPGLPVVF